MVKIALDLDGVITDIGNGIKSLKDDVTDEQISEALFNPNGHSDLDFVFDNPLFWRNLKPIQESWFKINSWYYGGCDVYFIIARRTETSIYEIARWLDIWQIGYTEYIVCDMMGKHQTLSELKPSVFIDDNPIEILNCIDKLDEKIKSEMTIKAIKTWYNSNLIIEHNVPHISSLEDIKIG